MTLKPFRILLPSFRRYRVDLFVAVLAAIGAQTIAIPMPLLMRWVVHRIGAIHGRSTTADAARTELLWQFAAMVAGLALLRGVLRWQQGMRGERMAQSVLADVRSRMYGHLQKLSQGYFDRRPTAKILIRFVGDANALRAWLARTVVTVPAEVLTVVGVAIALAVIRVDLLVVAGLPLFTVLPVLWWINPRARKWTREGRRSQTRLCDLLGHRMSAVNVIKSIGVQEAVADEVQEVISHVATANTQRGRLDAWGQSLSASAAVVSLGAVGFWGVHCHLAGSLSQADLLAAVWLTLLLRGPVTRLTGANVVHQRARVAVERIGALLQRAAEPGWSPTLSPYTGPGRTIRIRRLGYKDAARNWVIRGLTTTMEGPGLVCITDESGLAGGVLFELLLRLRRPHHGRIYLDGQNARKVRVADLRRRMGWVDRERRVVEVAPLSMRHGENSLEDPRFAASWESTRMIARDAPAECAGHMVRRPLARHVRLRLAIAYALVEQPPILLLDDPTMQLTDASAQCFLEWLQAESFIRLVIVATNDPRIIRAASQTIHLPQTTRDSAFEHGPLAPPTVETFRARLSST